MNIHIEVSRHAKRRMKQRLGLNAKAAQRQATRAYTLGKFIQKIDNNTRDLYEYQDNNYIFATNDYEAPVCVTVIPKEPEVRTLNTPQAKQALKRGWNH